MAAFFLDLEGELLKLQAELRDGRYQPGPYRQFWIRDRKPRLISAAPFRDRVVHHAVMAPLEPWLDRAPGPIAEHDVIHIADFAYRLTRGTPP